jgi:cyclic pyranopterin phosphate synthase
VHVAGGLLRFLRCLLFKPRFEQNAMSSGLTHFDDSGASRMVDVSAKEVTHRTARAEAMVAMQAETLSLIRDQKVAKGDVFEVARLAGIMAAKQTANLIPLCHSLPIDGVTIDFAPVSETALRIEALVKVAARTGVEMEALTAVSVAALTVYDMCKAVDKGMTIGPIRLLEKSGGRSGHYVRSTTAS